MPQEYHLIEQTCVTDVVAEAHAEYSRFHDLYDGLTWRLCRDPVPDEARWDERLKKVAKGKPEKSE